ncbi:MAG: pyridoxamine 5'-phosphate oxidase family protein [Actinomycetota bacterium]|nr:pyridoxamine 5'-phosphate oxidase family protein [Actinomycetota bacterium]
MNESPRAAGELLSDEECIALLKCHSLGRIGLSINALPAILPVVYHIVEGVIVIEGWGSARIAQNLMQSVVAFEVDDLHDTEGWGWSVLVIGVATSVNDASLESDETSPYPRKGSFVIHPDLISGRRVAFGHSVSLGKDRSSTLIFDPKQGRSSK